MQDLHRRGRRAEMARFPSFGTFLVFLFSLGTLVQPSIAKGNQTFIQIQDGDGNSAYVPDSRKPALYTGNFGDCLGSSLINVTRFDAAYYKDNMTVLFHMQGNTNVRNESLMSMCSKI